IPAADDAPVGKVNEGQLDQFLLDGGVESPADQAEERLQNDALPGAHGRQDRYGRDLARNVRHREAAFMATKALLARAISSLMHSIAWPGFNQLGNAQRP